MKINVYQFIATPLHTLPGAYKYKLEYFNATDDFTEFEIDMERIVSIKTLILKLDIREGVGTIYDEETGELTQMPYRYIVNDNNQECFLMKLLNKYVVLIIFHSCWVRMYHEDSGLFNEIDQFEYAFHKRDDTELKDSIKKSNDAFNVKLATEIALYDYDLRNYDDSPIYY